MGAILILLLARPACGVQPVLLTTRDGWTLTADYEPPRRGKAVVVMIHGVAAGRGEWARFSRELRGLGLGTLALDLRGHGGSLKGPVGSRTFEDFDAAGEWPRARQDAEAAVSFLRKKGIPFSKIALAGASIGANIASQTAHGRKLAWLMLLSPGLDYRGVRPDGDFSGNRVLLAASPSDSYAYQTVLALARTGGEVRVMDAGRGHGVQMFEDPAFLGGAIAWIESLKGL